MSVAWPGSQSGDRQLPSLTQDFDQSAKEGKGGTEVPGDF